MSGTQLFNSHPSQICFYHYRSFYQTIRQCAQKDAQNLLVPHRVRARHLCNCRAPTSQPPPGSLSSSPSTLIQKSGHSPNPLGAPLTLLTLSSGSVRSHSLEHLSFSSFSLSQSAFFLQGLHKHHHTSDISFSPVSSKLPQPTVYTSTPLGHCVSMLLRQLLTGQQLRHEQFSDCRASLSAWHLAALQALLCRPVSTNLHPALIWCLPAPLCPIA